VCSDSGFLLETSLLKACELRRITLMRSSSRSYRIRFRKSSGTAPEEYRSSERRRYHPTPMPRTLMKAHRGPGARGFWEGELRLIGRCPVIADTCPDGSAQFPDSVRGLGGPLPGCFGRTITKRGRILARDTKVSNSRTARRVPSLPQPDVLTLRPRRRGGRAPCS
jgi:hypothetical protein